MNLLNVFGTFCDRMAFCAVYEAAPITGMRGNPWHMRLDMSTNLKVMLLAVGVAALLSSPAMARTGHYYAPFYGYYGAYYGPGGSYGPYTPAIRTRRHGFGRDFQDGSRG